MPEKKINVKFEYLNEKGETNYSKEYSVTLNLGEDDEVQFRLKIYNTCSDFKTKEERFYYYMFDPQLNLFITNIDEIKDKKIIIMKNCSVFAKQIIEQIREEESRYKLGKNLNVGMDDGSDQLKKVDTTAILEDKDKKKSSQILKTIFSLKKNYCDIDLFVEEFISFEGIKYLISFLQYVTGNLRTYGIEALDKILTFESSAEYIKKAREVIESIYEILIKSDTINCSAFTLNTLITIISQDQQQVVYLIDVIEKYAKKSVTPAFSQIISLLYGNKDINIKTKTLLFINVLMNFCDSFKLQKLLKDLKDAGIYEALEKVAKIKEKDFQDQLTNFQMKTQRVIAGSDYELEVYKKQLEEAKEKSEKTEKEYQDVIESYVMYENIIQELLCFLDYSTMKSTYYYPIAPKHRFGNNNPKPQIKYDNNGIFDFKEIYSNSQGDKRMDLLDNCRKLKDDCNKKAK